VQQAQRLPDEEASPGNFGNGSSKHRHLKSALGVILYLYEYGSVRASIIYLNMQPFSTRPVYGDYFEPSQARIVVRLGLQMQLGVTLHIQHCSVQLGPTNQ